MIGLRYPATMLPKHNFGRENRYRQCPIDPPLMRFVYIWKSGNSRDEGGLMTARAPQGVAPTPPPRRFTPLMIIMRKACKSSDDHHASHHAALRGTRNGTAITPQGIQ